MSTHTILLNAEFQNESLPVVTIEDAGPGTGDTISDLPSLFARYNLAEGSYQQDQEGFLQLLDLAGSGVKMVKDPTRPGAPTLVEGAVNGQNAMAITRESGGLLRESEDMPTDDLTFFTVFRDTGQDEGAQARFIAGVAAAPNGPVQYCAGANAVINHSSAPGANDGGLIQLGRTDGVWFATMTSLSGVNLYAAASMDWTVIRTIGHREPVSLQSFYIGQSESENGGSNGQFAELIILNKAITDVSDADFQAVTQYLSDTYGL